MYIQELFEDYLYDNIDDESVYNYFVNSTDEELDNFYEKRIFNGSIKEIRSPRLAAIMFKRLYYRDENAEDIFWYYLSLGYVDFIQAFQNAKIIQPNNKYYINLFYSGDMEKLRTEAFDFLAQRNQVCRVYIENESLKDILAHNFIPSFDLYPDAPIILENITVPIEVLDYFYGRVLDQEFFIFETFTENYARRLSSKTTTHIRYTYPHLLYRSQRIRTDMSMYRLPGSNIGNRFESKLITAYGEYTFVDLKDGIYNGNFFVPVTRYSATKETGLYYTEVSTSACGTFYYLEDESTTCLLGTRILVAETKCQACNRIDPEASKGLTKTYYNNNGLNILWDTGKIKKDLILTPRQEAEIISLTTFDYIIPEVGIYQGKLFNLYAEEDIFDPLLCKLAKQADIDLVVLTRMVGAKQVVMEVYDVRKREKSFKNLIYTN